MAFVKRALARSSPRTIPSHSPVCTSSRVFSSFPSHLYAPKESADKNTINVFKDEYSKSGGDDVVAEQKIASYGPSDTKPDKEMESAGRGNVVNPLEVSPANREASSFTYEKDGHPEKGADKTGPSKSGSPAKHQTVNRYEKRTEHEVWEKVNKGARNS